VEIDIGTLASCFNASHGLDVDVIGTKEQNLQGADSMFIY
jgi:hypothetical protein